MKSWIMLLGLWIAINLLLVRLRYRRSVASQVRRLAFEPREPLPAEKLFGLLLGGNLAVFEGDHFNAEASALGRRRITEMLEHTWQVASPRACRHVLAARMRMLGSQSPAEEVAYRARRQGLSLQTEEFLALDGICRYLVGEARVCARGRLAGLALSPLACDIQHAAYLARLGFSAGWLTRDELHACLGDLAARARAQFSGWEEFSICALVGLGVRSRFDAEDLGAWPALAQTHRVLMASGATLLRHAGAWSHEVTVTALPSVRRPVLDSALQS